MSFEHGRIGALGDAAGDPADTPQESGYAQGSERSLLSALLFDGIQAYMNYVFATSARHRTRYREAFLWVTSSSREDLFGFDNVCEALGMDPNYIRHGLHKAELAGAGEWRHARRNF